ncbi:hypothetical protein [Antribacter gilvus]|uniref:hypothetical protein n=1 Tax=Antribacter gilvus TaxID=2304675 RepID=UPI0013E02B38|nr:hypothetical protein [Antribacter gilvus]
MSENPDRTTPYDPDDDPDTQPASLNPREGEQASGQPTEGRGEYEDTDADPANLNPRVGEQARGDRE